MIRYTFGKFETNTYVITDGKQAMIVDPGLETRQLVALLKDYEVVGILLTHGHIDHIDGIGFFSCPIYIHQKEIEFLKDETLSLYRMTGLRPSYKVDQLQIITVKEGDTIPFGKDFIQVIHTPGHTRGSVCYLHQRTLFSGDTLFLESCGRTDLPTGSEKELKQSLEKLSKLSNSIKVYPGHDQQTTIQHEKKNNPFL